jgi:hypothetical protein
MTPLSYAERAAERFDRRPGILTITAGLLAAYGLGSMTAGVSSAGDPKAIQQMIAALPGFHAWLLTRYGSQGLVGLSTFQGLLLIVTAVGVWLLKPWGRLLLYLVSFLAVVLIVQLAIASRHFGVFTPLALFLVGWPLWYLSLPHVKELFAAPSAPSATQD